VSSLLAQQWEERRAARDAAVIAEGFAYLAKTARKMMPDLSAEDAREMRLAIFAGPDGNLAELVGRHQP
jgi:hypothetical protein